jgi:hypothetical protein
MKNQNQPYNMMGTQMQGQGNTHGQANTIMIRREHKEKRTSVRDPCISLVSTSDLTPLIQVLNPQMRHLQPYNEKERLKHPIEFLTTDEGYYEVELKDSWQMHFQDLVFLTIVDKLTNCGYKYKYHYEQVAGTTHHKREVFVYQLRKSFGRNNNRSNNQA